jgi:hypothetical protein
MDFGETIDYTMITYSYQWQTCGISDFYLTGKK